MKKLQQVQFLKRMGYSLQDINETLSESKWDWSISLKYHLSYIMEEQERLKSIESSLRELINSIAIESGNEQVAIQNLIQLSNQNKLKMQALRENMFNDDELDLWTKLPNMKGEDPDPLEWIALLGQIKQQVSGDPASSKVQNIIRRMLDKQVEEFKGEDVFIDKL